MADEAERNKEVNIGASKTVTVLNPVGYPPKITPKPMAARLESVPDRPKW